MGAINNPNFEEKRNKFIGDLRSKSRSEATVIAYAKDIEQLLNFFSKEGIATIQDTTI